MSIKDVHPQELAQKLSDKLKDLDEIKPPEWSDYVKTGPHKERPPSQPDWWYRRSASVLRKVYEKGPIGVSRLRSMYGGRIDRGSSPEKSMKGSGKIIRTILQQLEAAGLVVKNKGKGRNISPDGMSFLTQVSNEIKNDGET